MKVKVEHQTAIENSTDSRQDKNLKITIVGDFVPGKSTVQTLINGDIEGVFGDAIPLLRSSDLSIINLETPLSKNKMKRPDLTYFHKSDPALARSLVDAGFSIAGLANNHILDLAEGGVIDTIEACEQAGLQTVGAGRNLHEASEPLIQCINGIKIAILAVAENEFSIASDSSAGANALDTVKNCARIIELKRIVDHTILVLHGGNEYWHFPSPELVKICRHFADMGVSAIACHHTHVYGGYEVYRNVPIMYGLGNFIFDKEEPIPNGWNQGLIVTLEIEKNELSNFNIIPCANYGGKIVFLDGASKENVIRKVSEISEKISDTKLLQAEWEQYCNLRYSDYLEYASCLGLLERYLIRIMPSIVYKAGAKRMKTLYNIINCESHRELLLCTLRKYMREHDN